MESNVVNNAYGYQDGQGRFVDQSKRNGYGMTMSWNNSAADPNNGVVANLSTAYLDASGEQDFTAGVNVLWRRFELGYIYAHNNIKEFNTAGSPPISTTRSANRATTTSTPFMRRIRYLTL